MARLSQHVVGDVRDAFEETREAGLVVAVVLVVEGEPVRGARVGMGPPELHAIEGPVDGFAQRIEGIGTEPVQARKLARHAFVGVVLAGLGEACEDPGAALGERRVRKVDPDLAAADLHRIGAQPLAAVEVPAAFEVELPVVPVAGQDAPLVEASLAQRIALVRAAVVAGEQATRGVEQRDLPPVLAEDEPPPVLERVEGSRKGPVAIDHERIRRRVSWSIARERRNGARRRASSPHPPERVHGPAASDRRTGHGVRHLKPVSPRSVFALRSRRVGTPSRRERSSGWGSARRSASAAPRRTRPVPASCHARQREMAFGPTPRRRGRFRRDP